MERKETVGSWSFGVIQIWCRLFGGVAKFRIKFTQIPSRSRNSCKSNGTSFCDLLTLYSFSMHQSTIIRKKEFWQILFQIHEVAARTVWKEDLSSAYIHFWWLMQCFPVVWKQHVPMWIVHKIHQPNQWVQCVVLEYFLVFVFNLENQIWMTIYPPVFRDTLQSLPSL